MNLITSLLVLSIPFAVVVNAAKSKTDVASAYEKAADLNNASFVTEIVFDESSAELSADGKSQMRDILNAAQSRGKIEKIKILSWADQEYPARAKRRLNKDERKLADERSLEIKGYIEDHTRGVNVDLHNMAEQPRSLEKILETADARVKRSLEKAGLAHPEKTDMPPKAGRALVMVIVR